MTSFILAPDENIYNFARFGGVKALEDAFLILDAGSSDLLVYMEVPTSVAVAWRDALVQLLSTHRRNRPVKQLDWNALAIAADPQWAARQGWTAPAATPGASAAE